MSAIDVILDLYIMEIYIRNQYMYLLLKILILYTKTNFILFIEYDNATATCCLTYLNIH